MKNSNQCLVLLWLYLYYQYLCVHWAHFPILVRAASLALRQSCQWSKAEGYGWNCWYFPNSKHNKACTICTTLRMCHTLVQHDSSYVNVCNLAKNIISCDQLYFFNYIFFGIETQLRYEQLCSGIKTHFDWPRNTVWLRSGIQPVCSCVQWGWTSGILTHWQKSSHAQTRRPPYGERHRAVEPWTKIHIGMAHSVEWSRFEH